jgi:type IV pilus assembly protein PilA
VHQVIWINKKLKDMREEDGFTLIELMVVVLIIAILIAIAIPTFLGARGRAQDRAAQSSLRNVVTNAKAIYTDNEDYDNATNPLTNLSDAEPSIDFVVAATDSTDPPNQVSVDGDPAGVAPAAKSAAFVAAGKSANGDRCWAIQDRVNPASNPGTWWLLMDSTLGCSADDAAAIVAFDDGVAQVANEWVKQPGLAVFP